MGRLGRTLQGLGLLLLLCSPFLNWARVPVLSFTLPVPGLFLRGVWVLVLAVPGAALWLLKSRMPGWNLVLALTSAGVLLSDLWRILTRTQYLLGKLQLQLTSFNEMLRTVQLTELQLYDRTADPWSFLAGGLWLGLAGALLLLLGSLAEIAHLTRGGKKSLVSVLLGRPACATCQHPVAEGMHFCPGCGLAQVLARQCPRCYALLRKTYRFCPECGAASASE